MNLELQIAEMSQEIQASENELNHGRKRVLPSRKKFEGLMKAQIWKQREIGVSIDGSFYVVKFWSCLEKTSLM